MRYDFIRQQKEAFPVTILCKVMEVSRSCFYYYLKRSSTHDKDPYRMILGSHMKTIFNTSKGTYGSRSIAKKLQSEGYHIGRYRVRSLMQQFGLKVKKTKRYNVTTDSHHSYPVAPNSRPLNFPYNEPTTLEMTISDKNCR